MHGTRLHAWVGYIPGSKYCGLSKLARSVKYFAAALQEQERITAQVANHIEENLVDPLGVAVVLKAEHMCMAIRGVKAPRTLTTTSRMKGVFSDHSRTAKAEFMEWMRGHQA